MMPRRDILVDFYASSNTNTSVANNERLKMRDGKREQCKERAYHHAKGGVYKIDAAKIQRKMAVSRVFLEIVEWDKKTSRL